MHQHKQSPMTLPFFEQQFQNVDVELRWFGQRNFIGRGRTYGRLANFESQPVTDRYDLRNSRISIEHGNRFSALNNA